MFLCQACQAFDLQSFAKDTQRTRGFHLSTLRYGAREGCDLCLLFTRALDPEIQTALEIFKQTDVWIHLKILEAAPTKSERSRGLGYSAMNAYLAPFPMRGLELKCIKSRVDFGIVAEPGSEAARNGDIIGQYLDVNDPISDAHVSTIQNWIGTCREEHQICRSSASTDTLLPTRCVEIHNDHLVLQETKNMSEPYVILSHRWNPATQLSMTLRSNYKERTEGFQALILPEIFQDAITITRHLGIRFIWIDSLCIIQDHDHDDWANEAPKMSQYYRNAHVTLAAATSEEATEAKILFPRELPWKGNLIRLPYRNREGIQKGDFYIYERKNSLENDFRSQVLETELLTRGWVQQERILSPRKIFFTNTRMFFECRDHIESESREMLSGIFAPNIREIAVEGGTVAATRLTKEEIFKDWYRLVETYSASKLTKPEKDRMVAIYGVAQQYKLMLEKTFTNVNPEASDHLPTCHYLWGLWLWNIHQGLLWQVCDDNGRPSNCGAPSWSWGSTCSTIKWLYDPRDTVTLECQVLQLQNSRGDLYDINASTLHDQSSPKGIVAVLLSKISLYSTPVEKAIFTTKMPAGPLDRSNTESGSELVQIRIKGALRHILISESQYFQNNDEQFNRVDALTGSKSSKGDQSHWRCLVDPRDQNTIIGWTSLDMKMSSEDGLSNILALHVSTNEKIPGGFKLGLATWYREIYNVILLFQEEDYQGISQYRRVGAGCVFEMNFFKDIKPSLILLT